jgi:pseudouridine-5'-phosphate glycosidase
VLGRKARLWYNAMIDQSPQTRLMREMWRMQMLMSDMGRELKQTIVALRSAVVSHGAHFETKEELDARRERLADYRF